MEYIIDIAKTDDVNLHEYLKEVFGFRDGHGMNLDALNDMVSEMSKVKIRVINAEIASEYQRKMINILIRNALENDSLSLEIVM